MISEISIQCFNNDKCEGGKLRKERHAIATGKVEILDGVAGEGL